MHEPPFCRVTSAFSGLKLVLEPEHFRDVDIRGYQLP
jgi:hypothetical protein